MLVSEAPLCTFSTQTDHHMQASDSASVCTEDFEQEFCKAFHIPGTPITFPLTNTACHVVPHLAAPVSLYPAPLLAEMPRLESSPLCVCEKFRKQLNLLNSLNVDIGPRDH